jgi:hypothetical protein
MDAAHADNPPLCGGNRALLNSDVVLCFRRSLLDTEPRYERFHVADACSSSRTMAAPN